jgi:phosphate starvation-inducible PhoH-like protein
LVKIIIRKDGNTVPKKTTQVNIKMDCPQTLDEHLFFGFILNKEQKEFRDAIWSKNYDIIFANCKAGTGKSLISIATAKLLVDYKRYERAYYIVSPVMNGVNGFLPGSVAEKEQPYYSPLFDALAKIGDFPEKAVNPKEGFWITPSSHVYTRGINYEKAVVIIDEAQNFYADELKKVLTRISSSCKVLVIGHSGQVDLVKNKENSGFVKYLDHFKDTPKCKICELTVNYRGWISQWADELEI